MSLSSIVLVFVDISIFVSNVNDISPVLNPATVGENKASGYIAKTYTCNGTSDVQLLGSVAFEVNSCNTT